MAHSFPPHIREPKRVARLGRTFSQSLSAVDLAEPLLLRDENQPAEKSAELLQSQNAGVLGVRRDGLVAGWVGLEDLTIAARLASYIDSIPGAGIARQLVRLKREAGWRESSTSP